MISCCLRIAMSIGKLPRASWAARIEQIPESCQDERCGIKAKAIGCRKVNADYLRMQWQMATSRKGKKS